MSVNSKIYEAIREEIIAFIIDQSPDGDVIGMCKIAASELSKRYPTFQVQSGHIIDYFEGRWNHFWCEAPNGDIADPTVDQFCAPVQYPSGEIWDYPIKLEDIELIKIETPQDIV